LALDDDARRRIAAMPNVRMALPIVTSKAVVLLDGQPSPSRDSPRRLLESVVGVDFARVAELPVTVLAGRLPTPGSLTEIALTPGYLQRFGIERKDASAVVGSEVLLGSPRGFGGYADGGLRLRGRWIRAEVVGIVAQDAGSGAVLASIEQTTASRRWIDGGFAESWVSDDLNSPYAGLFVIARSLDQVPKVRAAITEMGYSTSAPENLLASVQRYVRVVEIVLGAIGTIALVIAAIGIANALLAAVRERRREIGILKAVGARDRDVLRVFLIEAAVMGSAGGTVGSAMGLTVAWTVASLVDAYLREQGLAGIHVGLPVGVMVAACCGATALAVAAGIAPACRAARLSPREAVDL
jgi:hypothetical protein